jgi:hypothetical protein
MPDPDPVRLFRTQIENLKNNLTSERYVYRTQAIRFTIREVCWIVIYVVGLFSHELTTPEAKAISAIKPTNDAFSCSHCLVINPIVINDTRA